jgi:hypothetical protein
MTVATFNEMFFPYFLFLGYFCLFCIVVHEARIYHDNIAKKLPNTDYIVAEEARSYPTHFKLAIISLIEKLNCQQIEALCQELNIDLSIRGHSKTSFYLQGEVKHIFRSQPKKVIAAFSRAINK